MRRFLALIVPFALGVLAAGACRSSVVVQEEEVVFRTARIDSGAVFLVGDFNGWNPTIDLLVKGAAGLEIRLYLLPGTYHYRFVASGASTRDPDNPCVDAQGNSCFTLVQRDGALEVTYAESAGGARAGSSKMRVTPLARVELLADKDEMSLFSSAGIKGVIDKRIDADLAVGQVEEFSEGKKGNGESFLLRALASYRLDRGALRAFTRPSGAIDLGDSLALIGAVGPYRYPVSLFSRGVELEEKFPIGLETRFLYLSRLRGYVSGLEGAPDSSSLFSERDYVDSDIYGLRLGAKINGATIRYLFREDRVAKAGLWRFPGFGGDLYHGFERDVFQGFSLSLPGEGGVSLDGELLFGKSYLSATGKSVEGEDGAADLTDVSLEAEREHGQRFSLGVSRTGKRLHAGLAFAQTTLEGDPAGRGGRPDGSRTSLCGRFDFGDPSRSIGLSGKVEQYSALNTGSTFWFGGSNFWLDGDEIAYDLIPFLSTRELYEVKLSGAWNVSPAGDCPWGTGLRLEMVQRGDASGAGPLFREAHIASGVAVEERLTLLLDMRGTSYRYGEIDRDFVDAFLSLRGSITKSLWCAIGAGVNPYGFDRWLYSFSGHGREDYLYERGLYRTLGSRGEAASMNALMDAEEALAEDRVVTFEAGFTF
ncbi:MAG: glycogen-binding domain-containing protein [Candidatus Krumholzibacteriaceae bacterium]|jgi:hypothetical protein